MIVVVLGMHRAGTSMLSSVLHAMGVVMGPDEHLTRYDPDSQPLSVQWLFYAEPGGYTGAAPAIENAHAATTHVTIPRDAARTELHFIAIVTDNGDPPLTRYGRVVVSISE